jgi:hypothetical protein
MRWTPVLAVGLLAASLTEVAVLATLGEARATERQHQGALGTGAALLTARDHGTLPGFVFGAGYTYGLSDQFNLIAEGSYTFFPINTADRQGAPTVPVGAASGSVGATYVLDVLRWVPYFGLAAGSGVFHGGGLPAPRLLPYAQLAAGLDYQVSREWSLGFSYRQHMFVTAPSDYPSLAVFQLRGGYTWGW